MVVGGGAGGEVAVLALQLQGRHGSRAAGWDEARARRLRDGDARLLAWGDEVERVLHIRVLRLICMWREGRLRAVGSGRRRGCDARVL
jgi:hypothetical protein